MRTQVVVTLCMEGIHSWPTCPFEGEAYLRFDHRHVFHIKLVKEVPHKDRAVEVLRWKRQVKAYLHATYGVQGVHVLGTLSCEMLAAELLQRFDCVEVEVLEDGENGARVLRKEEG